jgi:ubiquinone/menaquinone biosynthesis C-methylase UbiE
MGGDPAPDETLVAGEYFLAVEGFALLRNALGSPSAARPRVDEMRGILARYEDFPNSLRVPLRRYDVEDGYSQWAPRYDSPNPAIAVEEPIVHGLLAEIPTGDALDAACGTGRHAAHLARLGHRVIGVDTTEAMLAIARAKVPDGDFRAGRLEALPVDDASVDLVTCTLALTHVERLDPVIQEFARVLRPGGRVVLSDIHPFATVVGNIAGWPERDLTRGIPYVPNLHHPVSDYVDAFLAAGLVITGCTEHFVTEDMLPVYPSFLVVPDATRQAFVDTPYLLVWQLARPGSSPGG